MINIELGIAIILGQFTSHFRIDMAHSAVMNRNVLLLWVLDPSSESAATQELP